MCAYIFSFNPYNSPLNIGIPMTAIQRWKLRSFKVTRSQVTQVHSSPEGAFWKKGAEQRCETQSFWWRTCFPTPRRCATLPLPARNASNSWPAINLKAEFPPCDPQSVSCHFPQNSFELYPEITTCCCKLWSLDETIIWNLEYAQIRRQGKGALSSYGISRCQGAEISIWWAHGIKT